MVHRVVGDKSMELVMGEGMDHGCNLLGEIAPPPSPFSPPPPSSPPSLSPITSVARPRSFSLAFTVSRSPSFAVSLSLGINACRAVYVNTYEREARKGKQVGGGGAEKVEASWS